MRVLLARSAGFCWGVKRAVDKARSLASQQTHPVHTDGPLIHNDQMMEQLRQEGIRECADASTLKDGTLMVRAHGIPPVRREILRELPVALVDATCPDVAKIQGLIRKHTRRGYHILIYGDDGHAEVEGLMGFAEGRGHVVGTPDEVAGLPELAPVCLVAQSTQFPEAFAAVADAVRRRFPGAEILDTICKSTRDRQRELLEIAGQVDAIVVVGGAHSANTVRLVELASTHKPTHHVQTADQLSPSDFAEYRSVGLTAGASTPAFIIESVKAALESM
jgi:(E)-4-hydroxy-3-methyl-but-2-enyl pyrophosphate reductase